MEVENKCPNCNSVLTGRYCAGCGQDSREFRRPVWRLVAQSVEAITDFDAGIWNSLIPLVFRPGFLTREFLAGRRKRYFPPVQMYAFFSFLFFLTAFYLPDPEGGANKDGVSEALSEVFYGPAPKDGSAKHPNSGSSFEISLNDQEANSISSLFVDKTTPHPIRLRFSSGHFAGGRKG